MGDFQEALRFTLKWEGGYVSHPQDPGGATNMGITQKTYDAYRQKGGLPPRPVREIAREEVEEIYRGYWAAIDGDKLPRAMAIAAFDAAVNSGIGRAREWLGAAGGDWRKLVALRLSFLASLATFPTFGRGWTRRVAALIQECASIDPTLEPVGRVVLYPGGQVRKVAKKSVVGDKLYLALEDEK